MRDSGPGMAERVVKAYETRSESLGVLLTVGVLLIVATVLIAPQQSVDGGKRFAAHQVNALTELSELEQALFVSLVTAGNEIDIYHDIEGIGWPTTEELADDGVVPFDSSSVVDSQAFHHWSFVDTDEPNLHLAVYLGESNDTSRIGNFILLLSHKHQHESDIEADVAGFLDEHFEIWYDRSGESAQPSKYDDPQLIREGWKEIVAYEGGDEVRRVKGNE